MRCKFPPLRQRSRSLYYIASLYRINTLAESAVPGISDVFSSSIGNQTITYDLSGEADNIIQRIDRQYGVGDGYNIFRGIEFQPNDVSLITRGGKNGYSCYIKGNDYIFIPPNALLGYTDCELPACSIEKFRDFFVANKSCY